MISENIKITPENISVLTKYMELLEEAYDASSALESYGKETLLFSKVRNEVKSELSLLQNKINNWKNEWDKSTFESFVQKGKFYKYVFKPANSFNNKLTCSFIRLIDICEADNTYEYAWSQNETRWAVYECISLNEYGFRYQGKEHDDSEYAHDEKMRLDQFGAAIISKYVECTEQEYNEALNMYLAQKNFYNKNVFINKD